MDGISRLVVTCGMECSLVGHRAESITGMAVKNHSGDWATLVWGLAPPSKRVFKFVTDVHAWDNSNIIAQNK